jgi:Transglycosylase SLT domain
MRRILIILTVVWFFLGTAATAGETAQVGADGASLVLQGGKGEHKGGEKLYKLLGQEVQVYIFNRKTRAWPKPIVMRGTMVGSGYYGSGYRSSWAGRQGPRLDSLINKYAGAYGVDPALVRAVMRNESDFNPGAVSPKGAQGLMQLMPGTASLMGVRDPFDPEQNIAGGVGYLRHCLDRFGHNVPLAVAAYNAGPEAVAKYCNIPPYQETQLFVNHVLGTYSGYGPNQALNNPNIKPPAGMKKLARGASSNQAATPENDKVHRRHRGPKIIEVRSGKIVTRGAIPILKD